MIVFKYLGYTSLFKFLPKVNYSLYIYIKVTNLRKKSLKFIAKLEKYKFRLYIPESAYLRCVYIFVFLPAGKQ